MFKRSFSDALFLISILTQFYLVALFLNRKLDADFLGPFIHMLKEPMDLRYNSRFIAILIMSIYPHISVFGKYTRMILFIIVYM